MLGTSLGVAELYSDVLTIKETCRAQSLPHDDSKILTAPGDKTSIPNILTPRMPRLSRSGFRRGSPRSAMKKPLRVPVTADDGPLPARTKS
jgi:hypothetical protein